jgi:transposase
MPDELTIITERIDDIPVLIAKLDRMGSTELLDEHFPMHGNWQGLSLGRTATGWLSHILSQADHRLNHVQGWAEKRLETLRGCLGDEVRAEDFADDRLASVLDALSDDQHWAAFEAALNQRILRVYDLKSQRVRLDSTTASGRWTVTEDGLFQFGHSKDGRPDLPQVKVMLSALDPLGLPLTTQVVSGEKADDPLYIPAIKQVRQGLQKQGMLYVGDCKLMSLETRTYLQAGADFYLGPFSKISMPDETLESYLQPVWAGQQELTSVWRSQADGSIERIAEGYERTETITTTLDGKQVTWDERRLVIRSLRHARAATLALQARLEKAQKTLEALNERRKGKERFTEVDPLRQAAEAILKREQVEGLLQVSYLEEVQEHQVRRYGERSTETRVERTFCCQVSRDEQAVQAAMAKLGWRVYATNQPKEQLSLEQAVLAYREEYLVEHNFARLKGKPLSLTPMYLQDDRRATGLIRLLAIGLRVLTLLEGVVRQRLAETQETLAGLYAGNPKRTTARPTAEALLEAFQDIHLNLVQIGQQVHRHITPLSELQQKILALLDLPRSIYSDLATHSSLQT